MSDSARQTADALRALLAEFPHTPRALVQSFGCQLNFCDGEKYKGILCGLGYELTDEPEQADVILYNACAVRAHKLTSGSFWAMNGRKVRFFSASPLRKG